MRAVIPTRYATILATNQIMPCLDHIIFITKFKSCGQEQGTEYFLTDNDYYFEGADDDVDANGDQ